MRSLRSKPRASLTSERDPVPLAAARRPSLPALYPSGLLSLSLPAFPSDALSDRLFYCSFYLSCV